LVNNSASPFRVKLSEKNVTCFHPLILKI